MKQVDGRRTLQDLEQADWGDPSRGETPMIKKCLAVRRRPIQSLSVEDLRLAIGQEMRHRFLIPLAMQHLTDDPLAQGDLYPGDLLSNVLRVRPESWPDKAVPRSELVALARTFLEHVRGMNPDERKDFRELIRTA